MNSISNQNNLKVLFIGDIVARPGRLAVETILPRLIVERKIDLVIANAENISGGRGVNESSILQMLNAGVNYFTSGNHVFFTSGYEMLLSDQTYGLLRPANYDDDTPGSGLITFTTHHGVLVTLINLEGEVIGINAAIVFGAQNIGFAIPINYAKRDLEDLKKYGRVRRPLLGLRYINIDDNFKEKMGLPVNYGALVAGKGPHHEAILPGTPAEKAGFKLKDIILECNGIKLTPEKTIQDFLEELGVGDTLAMKILRDNKPLEIKVVLAERK